MKRLFGLKNIAKIMKNELKLRLKSMLIWSFAMSLIMFFYMSVYGSVKEKMLEKFANMPQEILAMIGVSDLLNMSDFSAYFSMVFKIILLIICGYAIFSSTTCLHDEESSGTIEFLNSQSVTRQEIVLAKFFTLCVNVIAIMICSMFATLLVGVAIGEETFDAMIIFKIYSMSVVVPLVFVSTGLLLASVLKKNVKASGIALGVFFGMYLFGYLSNLGVESLTFFKWLSPADYINPNQLLIYYKNIAGGSSELIGFIVSIVLIIAGAVSSTLLYSKKDL
jgi:ABC-2 type transport system permease protein